MFAIARRNDVPPAIRRASKTRGGPTASGISSPSSTSITRGRASCAPSGLLRADDARISSARPWTTGPCTRRSSSIRRRTRRGASRSQTVVRRGSTAALADGEAPLRDHAPNSILCFLRHLPSEDAARTLAEALPFRDWIRGVGLDSSEAGNPPSKFASGFRERPRGRVPARSRTRGKKPPALHPRGARRRCRRPHRPRRVRCAGGPGAVARSSRRNGYPLTVCPLSNVKLGVFPCARAAQPEGRCWRAGGCA